MNATEIFKIFYLRIHSPKVIFIKKYNADTEKKYSLEKKKKTESSSTSVNVNWFIPSDKTNLLIFSWFFSTERFKIMHSNFMRVNSNLIKIKCALSKFSALFYRTYNRICALDINAHNDQGYARIKKAHYNPHLLPTVSELKHSAGHKDTYTYLKQRKIYRKTI